MIGGAHEPSAEVRSALNNALGEGKYEIEYRQVEVGTVVVVRTREQPPRTWSSVFAPGTVDAQAKGVWEELAERVGKTLGAIEYPRPASGHPQVPSSGEVAPDVASEPGNPGDYGTRDYERNAEGEYVRKAQVSLPPDVREAFDRALGANRWHADLRHADDITTAAVIVLSADGSPLTEHTAEGRGVTATDGLWRRIATDLADASDDDETDIAPERP